MATLIGRDVVNGNAVDQAGHILMEVLAGAEGLYQRLITGKVGHDAQFDLRVVGAQQRFEALSRHERGSNLTTCGIPVRNVLQVWIDGAQSSGGCHRLFESGVDATVMTVCGVDQRLHDLLELVLFTMHQQRVKELACAVVIVRAVTQGLQCRGIGGV